MLFAAVFIGSGVLFQLAAHLWPLQRQAKSETRLDITALLWAGLMTAAYTGYVIPQLQAAAIPGVERAHATIREWGVHPIVTALVSVVIVDFLSYWTHRLNHTTLFWSTHAFHHSTKSMNWLSGVRESPIHYLLVTLPGSLVAVALPPEGASAWLIGALVAPVLNQHLTHSNIRVRWGFLGSILVTPKYHFIHHSADRIWSNSNFGFVFTFWDRIFGTLTDPRTIPDDFPLGLDYEINTVRLFVGMPARVFNKEDAALSRAA